MQVNLVSLGVLFVFVGFLLLVVGSFSGAKAGESKVAVVGLLGPIPFGFGNDRRLFFIALALVGLMAAWALFWGR